MSLKTDIDSSFVLAVRLPVGAVPGVVDPQVWWIVERCGDEVTARQRAFKVMPFVAGLGGEAVLMYLAQGAFGRALESHVLIRHLPVASAPPPPEDLRLLGAARLAEFHKRCRKFHAPPGRIRIRFRLREHFGWARHMGRLLLGRL